MRAGTLSESLLLDVDFDFFKRLTIRTIIQSYIVDSYSSLYLIVISCESNRGIFAALLLVMKEQCCLNDTDERGQSSVCLDLSSYSHI